MTECDLPDPLQDLPPSRNHVYHALRDVDGPATRADLTHATGLTPRSITNAIADLADAGLVSRTTDPLDARRTHYRTTEFQHE